MTNTGALRCRSSEISSFQRRCSAPAGTTLRMSAPRTHRARGEAHAMPPRGHERRGSEIGMRASPLAVRSHPPPNCTLVCVNAFVSTGLLSCMPPTWHGPRPAHNTCACRGKGAGHTHTLRFHALGVSIHSRTIALSCCSLCVRTRGVSRIVCVYVTAELAWARPASTGLQIYAPHGLPGAVTPLDHALIVRGPARRRRGAQGTTLPRDAALRTQEDTCQRRYPCGRAGPLAALEMHRAQSRPHRLRAPISAHGRNQSQT